MSLSPHGSVWERFLRRRGEHASDELAEFFHKVVAGARAYDLGDDSVYLAEELVRMQWSLGQPQQRALALLVLASFVSVRQGSTRLPLSGGVNGTLGRLVSSILDAAGIEENISPILRRVATMARSMTFDRLIGGSGEYRPLIVDSGCIYQQRMFLLETRLSEAIARRATRELAPLGDVDAALEGAVAEAEIDLSDEQVRAVRHAIGGALTVVSGGPGTGKTAIVMTVLRALSALGVDMDQVALAAPTGKAAQRMANSIKGGPEPQTLHRLLGYSPQLDRFRHHENHPLAASFVLVDEASMIDLSLMDRLVRAVGPNARLVLLGDADQLPSVDAGAVLRDLVLAGQEPPRPGARAFACRLSRSYRMDPSDPAGRAILTAAAEVNAGRASAIMKRGEHVTHRDSKQLEPFVRSWYRDEIASPELARLRHRVYRRIDGRFHADDRAALGELLGIYERARILTVTRRLSTGAEAINRRLHELAVADLPGNFSPELSPGEPVIVRENDYGHGLFNGDQGVVARVAGDSGELRLRAVFLRAGELAVFNLDMLESNLDLGYALTVHRSQGSEYGRVALVLPHRDLPILTRELIYTAVTRAKSQVTVVGQRSLLKIGVHRRAQRFSGIAERLARS